jgi:MoaA/NifB/PqqE/SkfB family radical SAM enzyme
MASVGLPALSLSGGEPLLRKDFFEVAAYARRKIPYLSIATNGTLLTKDNVKLLKDASIDYVEISLDGASEEVHEAFRRVPGCFEKTMKGIRNSMDEGLDTCIATTLHRENVGEFQKIVELVDQLGVRFMHFNYIPTGRAKAHVELDLTPQERLAILDTIGRKIVDLSIQAKEEEQTLGKSDLKVDRFFSTCPQYASVVKK